MKKFEENGFTATVTDKVVDRKFRLVILLTLF